MKGPSLESLLEANETFYHTFESLNFEDLRRLWENSERVFCVYPGWPPLIGYPAVLDSWQRIMRNTSLIRFSLTGVRAHLAGELGIVTCTEQIQNESGQERHNSGAVSTNLFSYHRQEARWLLFHHHAAHTEIPAEGDEGVLN